MRLCTVDFILREAGANIRRNALMSLACVTTVAVTLGFSGFVVIGFRNAESVLQRIAQELVVAVYLKTDAPPAVRDRLGSKIAHVYHVKGAPTLVTKEQAWKQFSSTIPDSLKGEVDGNPLPDAYMVRVDAPINVPKVANQLNAFREVDRVNAPYLEAHRAAAILHFARLATDGVTGLLLIISTFLVMNTIRLTLFARRHEIRVMQLVGAGNGYIRTPFVLEGLALGALGGILACAALAVGYPYLYRLAHQALSFDLPLLAPGREMAGFYVSVAGIGAAIGAFGSIVSVRRFLGPVEYQVSVRRLKPRELEDLRTSRMGSMGPIHDGGELASIPTQNYPPHRDDSVPEYLAASDSPSGRLRRPPRPMPDPVDTPELQSSSNPKAEA